MLFFIRAHIDHLGGLFIQKGLVQRRVVQRCVGAFLIMRIPPERHRAGGTGVDGIRRGGIVGANVLPHDVCGKGRVGAQEHGDCAAVIAARLVAGIVAGGVLVVRRVGVGSGRRALALTLNLRLGQVDGLHRFGSLCGLRIRAVNEEILNFLVVVRIGGKVGDGQRPDAVGAGKRVPGAGPLPGAPVPREERLREVRHRAVAAAAVKPEQ